MWRLYMRKNYNVPHIWCPATDTSPVLVKQTDWCYISGSPELMADKESKVKWKNSILLDEKGVITKH